MKAGMLFPGQGSQYVGMGKDLYDAHDEARALYKEADASLGFAISELSFSGDMETLTQTRNAQPAILLHSLVVLRLLEGRGVIPDVVAGHSLGEFSALVAAGFFEPMDALRIVRRRGEIMYEAGLARPGTMASVLGSDEPTVEACAERVSGDGGVVIVANYNAPGQYVLSGDVEAVRLASDECKEAGAKRVIPLNVSGAFHSPLLESAVDEFRGYLQSFDHGELRVAWVSNLEGKVVEDPGVVMDTLSRQLASPVRWTRCMETFSQRCASPVYEVGPGKVLSGLYKRIVADGEVTPLGERAALEAL